MTLAKLALLPFAASFLMSVGLLAPESADAWSIRQACEVTNRCIVVDRPEERLKTVDYVNVHWESGNTNLWAKACLKYWHTSGGWCETAVYDSNADGAVTLYPASNDSDVWGANNEGHFKYVAGTGDQYAPAIQGLFIVGS